MEFALEFALRVKARHVTPFHGKVNSSKRRASRYAIEGKKRFLRATPPLRGSRQDEGASPKSRQWGERRKRLPRPAAQENRKGRLGSPSRGERWEE